MNPLVSIIIPVYNAEEYVEETILSAIQQTYTNTEIIVVDDGSKDRSIEIINRYKNSIKAVLQQQNRGASAARNYGLTLAEGDYIQFLDADDILHPLKIQQQVNTLKYYPGLHLIGCLWQRFEKDVKKPFKAIPSDITETQHFDKVEWLIKRPYMVPHTWLVPAELIKVAGKWDERLSFNDDGEFFYRVIAASAGVIVDTRAVVYYRSGNGASLSRRRDREAMFSWVESIKSYKRIVRDLAGEKGNESVNKYFYEISYNCLNKFPELVKTCKLEMYYPEKNYNLSDTLVFKLSGIVGLSNAKRVRMVINAVRQTAWMRFLIYRIKTVLDIPSY